MKKVMNNYKMIAIGLAAVLTLGISNATFASGNKSDAPSELKFIGKDQSLPVFQLNLNNSVSNEYVITIKEASGNILYSEKVSGEKISKRFKLDAEDADIYTGTTFEVTNKATNETTVYKINNTAIIVQDVVIARL
jgi:hypothetical protein